MGEEAHKQVMDAINGLDNKMNIRFNQMEERVINEVQKLKLKITEISEEQGKQRKVITDVQIEVEILKQKALNCDFVVLGIPNLKPQDNLLSIVNRVLAITGCNSLRETDVKSIFLMRSGTSKSKFSPICLQLYSATFKGAILSQQKKYGPVPLQKIDNTVLESDTNKIIFKPRMTQFHSHLLKETFKFKNQFKYCYCWFQDDTVLLKQTESSKPIRISCFKDLENLAEVEKSSLARAPTSSGAQK